MFRLFDHCKFLQIAQIRSNLQQKNSSCFTSVVSLSGLGFATFKDSLCFFGKAKYLP